MNQLSELSLVCTLKKSRFGNRGFLLTSSFDFTRFLFFLTEEVLGLLAIGDLLILEEPFLACDANLLGCFCTLDYGLEF